MAGEMWPPQGWPPPIDPALMGAPMPGPQPMPELQWPPPEYEAMLAEQQPPVDPVAQADAQILAQPPGPPAPPANDWAPPEWQAEAAPAPQAAPAPEPVPGVTPPRVSSKPGYAGQIETTSGIKEDSILRQGELEGGKADARARGMAEQARAAEMYDIQQEKRAAERKADLDQRFAAIEKDRAELANAKVDPTKFYSDMSTGQRIGWAVSAALAGMLAVRSGSGRNSVLDQMNRMVDADIEAQRANIANKRAGVDSSQSLLQQYMSKYGDEETAAGMMKAAHMDRIAREFEAQAAQYDNPIAKENALQGAALAREQGNAAAYTAAVTSEQRAFENKMQQRQVGIQAYNAATSRKNVDAEIDARKGAQDAALAKLSAEEQKKVVRGPDGAPIVDPKSGSPLVIDDDTERKEASKKMRAYGNYRTALADYLADVEKEGVVRQGWAQSEAATRLQAKRANLFNAWRGMVGAGTIDQGSLDAFSKVVPEPSGWVTGYDPVAGVRTTLELTDKAMDSDMRSYGYSGNWSADYQAEVPFSAGDTQATGNRQDMEFIPFTPAGPPRGVTSRPQGIGPY